MLESVLNYEATAARATKSLPSLKLQSAVCSASSGCSHIVGLQWNYVIPGTPQVGNPCVTELDVHTSDCR